MSTNKHVAEIKFHARAVAADTEKKITAIFGRNLIKINTCLYSIFETYLSYWGYLIAVNLQIFLETSSLKHANNVTKLPGVDYVAKNWVLAMMFKALLLVHFWSLLLLKEQILTSVRKTLKTLV